MLHIQGMSPARAHEIVVQRSVQVKAKHCVSNVLGACSILLPTYLYDGGQLFVELAHHGVLFGTALVGVASETKSVVVFTGPDAQVDDARAVLGFV